MTMIFGFAAMILCRVPWRKKYAPGDRRILFSRKYRLFHGRELPGLPVGCGQAKKRVQRDIANGQEEQANGNANIGEPAPSLGVRW